MTADCTWPRRALPDALRVRLPAASASQDQQSHHERGRRRQSRRLRCDFEATWHDRMALEVFLVRLLHCQKVCASSNLIPRLLSTCDTEKLRLELQCAQNRCLIAARLAARPTSRERRAMSAPIRLEGEPLLEGQGYGFETPRQPHRTRHWRWLALVVVGCALAGYAFRPGWSSSGTPYGLDPVVASHLGLYSPWQPSPRAEEYSVPNGCTVDQVNILQRHGSRYPTLDAAARIAAALDNLQQATSA